MGGRIVNPNGRVLRPAFTQGGRRERRGRIYKRRGKRSAQRQPQQGAAENQMALVQQSRGTFRAVAKMLIPLVKRIPMMLPKAGVIGGIAGWHEPPGWGISLTCCVCDSDLNPAGRSHTILTLRYPSQ